MGQAKTDDQGELTVVSTSALSPLDKALIEFGEQLFVGSVAAIRDFAKGMVALISGIFISYFAILKFLGTSELSKAEVQSSVNIATVPPFLFILSIIAFVFAILPLYGKVSLNMPDSIGRTRRKLTLVKYVAVLTGTVLFVLGLCLTAIMCLGLLLG